MDIWKWVNNLVRQLNDEGHARVAQLIYEMPDATCDDRHAHVDAIYPEALALAREMEHEWLELYFRHWYLQSRILHRYEVSDYLSDAVALVDFAHQESTLSCPQSRCASQNLACAYGYIDGPGYAEERLTVAEEALSRVNPHWPCFNCISAEKSGAMVHAGETEQALEFIVAQRDAIVEVGKQSYQLASAHAELLVLLGRYDEAIAVMDEAEPWISSDHTRIERDTYRARALAGLGNYEAGAELLPPVSAIEPTPALYSRWAEALETLLVDQDELEERTGVVNSWQLDGVLQRLQATLVNNGVQRLALEMALRRARFALRRGALATASHCVAQAEARVPFLRKPLEAPEEIAVMRGLLAEARKQSGSMDSPPSAEAILKRVGENPEKDFELLAQGVEEFPDNDDIWQTWVAALMSLRRWDLAEQTVLKRLAGGDTSPMPRLTLARVYRETDRGEDLAALGRRLVTDGEADADPRMKADGHWILAQAANADGDLDSERAELEAVLEGIPDAVNTRAQLAGVLRQQKEWAKALERYDEILEQVEGEEEKPWLWEKLVVATLCQDWAAVRIAGSALGMEFETDEGPVEEHWGAVRLRFPDGQRGNEDWGLRTGPVTATVVTMAPPQEAQHFEDRVVFDPAPVAEPDPDQGLPPVFTVLEVQEQGGYSSTQIIGDDPGREAVEEAEDAVAAADAILKVFRGGDGAPKAQGDDPRAPFVALVGVRGDSDLDGVNAALEALRDGVSELWVERVDG